MKKLIVLLFSLSVLFNSCSSTKGVVANDVQVKKDTIVDVIKPIKIINIDSLNNIISNNIEVLVSDLDSGKYIIDKQVIFSKSLLPNAYKNNNYSQLWLSDKNRADAIESLKKANAHGLIPNDYHLEAILELNDNYENLTLKERAKLDVILTDGIVLYSFHLIKGKVSPHDFSYSWNFIEHQLPKNKEAYLYKSLDEEKLKEALYSLEPQDDEYKSLKNKLATNKEIIKNGGWSKVNLKTPLHVGDTDDGVLDLRKLLIIQGYFTEEKTEIDSLLVENDTLPKNIFNSKLEASVKHFQKEHGLNPDGVVGKHTLKVINTSPEEYQKKIVCSLERRRWLQYPTDEPYVKVNIASFRMQFIENGDNIYSSNVVIGKIGKETPLFTKRIKLVVLNPTWTLPRSITTTETLRRLKANPNYLDTHNMNLIDRNGRIINNHGIDWNKYKEGHFPYMVRQEPGPHNALGQVKFLFPNKYSIYLHDTPSKYLFSKEKRAFSHGCIRLQNPLDFALFLLQRENKNYWSKEKINKIIKTSKLKNIRLKHEYPILLMYQTASMSSDGDIIYYQDIYDRDNKLYNKIQGVR